MTKILNQDQYSTLLHDIQTLKQEASTKSNQDLITNYWQIGARITEEQLSTNANYHNSIIRNLAIDLSMDRSNLSRFTTFHNLYKTPPTNNILSWIHYRHLITIKDENFRNQLEKQAINENWSKNQLISAIKQSTKKIDPKQKTILKRPSEPTYLYKAKIIKVIDGDTLNLYVDLGFSTHKEQRIRLANIDCPEIETKDGKKSRQFTQNQLAKSEFVMIQTRKADIYGRFIAHVFYDPTNKKSESEIFQSGNYLNEDLLQNGFAIEI